jgi:hypothetical protein
VLPSALRQRRARAPSVPNGRGVVHRPLPSDVPARRDALRLFAACGSPGAGRLYQPSPRIRRAAARSAPAAPAHPIVSTKKTCRSMLARRQRRDGAPGGRSGDFAGPLAPPRVGRRAGSGQPWPSQGAGNACSVMATIRIAALRPPPTPPRRPSAGDRKRQANPSEHSRPDVADHAQRFRIPLSQPDAADSPLRCRAPAVLQPRLLRMVRRLRVAEERLVCGSIAVTAGVRGLLC